MNKLRAIVRNRFFYLLISILFFVATILVDLYRGREYYQQQKASQFQETLHHNEDVLDGVLSQMSRPGNQQNFDSLMIHVQADMDRLYREHGIVILGYKWDTLQFWSSISATFPTIHSKSPFTQEGLIRLDNGWYEVRLSRNNRSVWVGLLLIKNDYPYRNRYLESRFHKSYALPEESSLGHQETMSFRDIKDNKDRFLLSLVIAKDPKPTGAGRTLPVILAVIGLLFILLYLEKECAVMAGNIGDLWAGLLLMGTVLILRHLMMKVKFPAGLYELDIFSPTHYAASSFFPSLGDFFINVCILFYLAVVVNKRIHMKAINVRSNVVLKVSVATGLLFLLFYYGWFITDLIRGLVEHSKVSMNLNDVFSLNAYSYIGFVSIGLLLFSFLLLADKWFVSVIRYVSDGLVSTGGRITGQTTRRLLVAYLIASGAYVVVSHFKGVADLIMMMWPLLIIPVSGYFRRVPGKTYRFSNVIVIVLLFALLTSHLLSKYNGFNEKKNMEYLASALAEEPDHIGEVLFSQQEDRILDDEEIRKYFTRPDLRNEDKVKDRVIQKYFSGYWDKYEVTVYLFPLHRNDKSNGRSSEEPQMQLLDRRINLDGRSTDLSDRLFRIEGTTDRSAYLARFRYGNNMLATNGPGSLYIELKAKIIPKGIGYPELLIDASNSEIKKRNKLENFSYAQYRGGSLVDHRGDFPYNLTVSSFLKNPKDGVTLLMGGYRHVFKVTGDQVTVVSGKQKQFLDHSSLFSYLFVFLSLFAALLATVGFLPLEINLMALNFKNRIQLYIMLILFFALTVVGAGTIYYINQQYNTANYQNIRERINSVLIEMENKLGDSPDIAQGMESYVTYVLKRFSNVFFTDINLFDKNGNLIASSRQNLFDQGLIARKMDPRAYAEMVIGQKADFVQEENVGKLKYFAAYVPFRNNNNELMAYLSLPYFAKKNEIERSVQSFMATLINIYGLLLMLTLLGAWLLASRITQPLQMIQVKLGKIKLGHSNEPIEWNSNDEIGGLVREYNRMIKELASSVEKLQKSERESAWQEMARQVAHEIKNPLTPMKLSIQHLERAWKDKAPDREERLKNFTRSMIEQIETLSTIATEFSNFAKMPVQKNEDIDLSRLLDNTTRLFEESEQVEVVYMNRTKGEARVFADKDQLVRVFNNLIKNGIQAIPEDRAGKIEVVLEDEGRQWIIEVRDNGSGIPRDQLDKIFVPNFTTKTGGMGLGLAMVKNIVEGFGGSIWFETSEGKGTVFVIALPKPVGSQGKT
ncbi:MAG: GHKL domain-containing protein [Flavobacteriales bacterium]|nr:GHKL domain-containing protein [Flavobacteriales bacterium]